MGRKQATLQERFWKKVDQSGGANDCWLWTGSCRSPKGYGQIGRKSGKPAYAHRVAWELANGPIPSGMCVLHHCDEPACVRPDHLFLGTVKQNNQDRTLKGRSASVLKPDQVKQIKALILSGVTALRIAEQFHISDAVVSSIKLGKTWRHVGQDMKIAAKPTLQQIAAALGISRQRVHQLKRAGKLTWAIDEQGQLSIQRDGVIVTV